MRASPKDIKLIIGLVNAFSDKLLQKLPLSSPSRVKLADALGAYIVRLDSSKRYITREQLLNESNKVTASVENAIDSIMKGNDVDFDMFVKTINPKFVPKAKEGTVTPIVKSQVKPVKPVKPEPVKPTKPKVAKAVKPKVVDPTEFNFKNVTEADKDLARQYHSNLGQIELDDTALEGAMQSDFADNGMKRVDYLKKVNKKKLSKEYGYDEDISDEEYDYNNKRSFGSNNANDYDGYTSSYYDNN